MKRNTLKRSEIVCGVIALIMFVIGLNAGSSYANKTKVVPLKRDAIQRGFAEWAVIDSETGKTEFAWKK